MRITPRPVSRNERYLVSLSRNGASRKFIWESNEPLSLGDSTHLIRTLTGLRLRSRDHTEDFPETINIDRFSIRLLVKKAPSLRAPYLPTEKSYQETGARIQISFGARDHLCNFQDLSKKYVGRATNLKAFSISKNKSGYKLQSRVDKLAFTLGGGNSPKSVIELKKKETRSFTETEIQTLTVFWGIHWWKLNRVATRQLVVLPPIQEPSVSDIENSWLKSFNKKLVIGCVAASLLLLVLPKPSDQTDAEKSLPPATLIALKKPKIIEKIVLPKLEPARPPVLEAKAQPEKVKNKKVKPEKHKQKPIAAPVPAVDPVVAQAREKAKEVAHEKANLAKSLNFLSTAPQVKAVVVKDQSDSRYKTIAQAVPSEMKNEALSKLAKTSTNDGPIKTSGAREMDTQLALSANGNKSLNEVQGRVSLSTLASAGSGEGVESLTSKGMTVAGDGSLSQSEIEKSLSKHLQRFQYCYEKSLLSDASLAGHILIQWTIGLDGSVSAASVVRSQLNNEGLHQCLMTEISKVHFSAPKGGSVLVKYPFSFSSTPM